jgi:hypothetical protein
MEIVDNLLGYPLHWTGHVQVVSCLICKWISMFCFRPMFQVLSLLCIVQCRDIPPCRTVRTCILRKISHCMLAPWRKKLLPKNYFISYKNFERATQILQRDRRTRIFCKIKFSSSSLTMFTGCVNVFNLYNAMQMLRLVCQVMKF